MSSRSVHVSTWPLVVSIVWRSPSCSGVPTPFVRGLSTRRRANRPRIAPFERWPPVVVGEHHRDVAGHHRQIECRDACRVTMDPAHLLNVPVPQPTSSTESAHRPHACDPRRRRRRTTRRTLCTPARTRRRRVPALRPVTDPLARVGGAEPSRSSDHPSTIPFRSEHAAHSQPPLVSGGGSRCRTRFPRGRRGLSSASRTRPCRGCELRRGRSPW